ncbi:MAG: CCA tRNA nucleotidyltransferase [Deltaproteobacteria bacterium]|nr:CCA tRNA nucleotidyltransferase [Deltaproteobacteria bacterium]
MEKEAFKIVKKLNEKGFTAYYAGGFVRDKLLGNPISDIDIATDAKTEDIQNIFEKTIPIGASFGVVQVHQGGYQFEVATFREEGAYSDGRHPDKVSFTTPEKDALRRDFTINGMFYDPTTHKIIDYIDGQKDLKKKVIRTIGDAHKRFEEDKLRMLRAVRFASRLRFHLEEKTKKVIFQMASHISQVSAERVRDEVLKILTSGKARSGFELLDEVGLLKEILPEISAMKGVEQPSEFHPEGDVYIHTMMMLEKLEKGIHPEVALGILLHDVGKPPTFKVAERIRFDAHENVGANMAAHICKRLRMSKASTEHVVSLVKQHMKFKDVKNMRESTLKRFLRQDKFQDHMYLHKIDCSSSHNILEAYEFCEKKIKEFGKEKMKPTPFVTGQDLINLGLKPGPTFKKILTLIEDAQLEGKIRSKEEALDLIKKNY